MTLTLPSSKTESLKFPDSAKSLSPEAIYNLARLSVAWEHRAWARSKVKYIQDEIKANIGLLGDETTEYLRDLKIQLADRTQFTVSMEKHYKKLRYVIAEKFPEALPAMEEMIPGSTVNLIEKNDVSMHI